MNEKINLHNMQAGRDALYNIQLEEKEGGLYVVNYQNGRRGSTLTSGTKTDSALPYAAAKKIYDALVKSKVKGGYDAIGNEENGYQTIDPSIRNEITVEMLPQLLNDIDPADVDQLLHDDDWALQQKMNGENRPIAIHTNGDVIGYAREGHVTALPKTVADFFIGFPQTERQTNIEAGFMGEIIGDNYYLFDCVKLTGNSLKDEKFSTRYTLLKSAYDNLVKNAKSLLRPHEHVVLIETAFTTDEKIALYNKVKHLGLEGLVFKRVSAKHVSGRPNSGGDQLREKFKASATVYCGGVNKGKRSVSIFALDASDQLSNVGNVTIPPNVEIPKEGDLIEVEYLDFNEGGSLFQPVFERPRKDKSVADKISSFKLKAKIQLAA